MYGIIEYYFTGGKITIGKKELALELLRKDSVLRKFLGFDSGNLKPSLITQSEITQSNSTNQRDNMVLIDFSGCKNIKLDSEPAPLLEELKNRYDNKIGGTLHFQLVYTTFQKILDIRLNLDEKNITLKDVGGDIYM
jgi:hypothetical protein